jgi:uncharacterized membrane protein YphA (DoxX/SURF4 family)
MRYETRATDRAIAAGSPLQFRIVARNARTPRDLRASHAVIGIAVIRITFGAIWAVDAALKWQPAFRANFGRIVAGVGDGQPGFLSWWFRLWQVVVAGDRAPIFALLTATTETYLACALIAGFARRITYTVGFMYGLFVWSVAEGFGGPYVPGTSTDVGAAIVYSLVFLALLLVDAGRFSVDRWIVRRIPAWRRVSD